MYCIKPETNISTTFHMSYTLKWRYLYIQVPYMKSPAFNHLIRSTVHTTFHGIGIYHWKIGLLHCKYRSHCPHFIHTYTCAIYEPIHNKFQHLLLCYCHIYTRAKYAHQTAHLCHMIKGHLWGMYVHICVIQKVTGIKHVIRSTIHIQKWQ